MTPAEIRNIRKATGLSQVRFARLLGCHSNVLAQWEQGRRSPQGASVAALRLVEWCERQGYDWRSALG